MEPNEETAPNVQFIFELARAGHGPGEIAKMLFQRGIQTHGEYKVAQGFKGHDVSRCHGVWHQSTVSRILEDERYTGMYIIGKREVTEVGGHRVRMKDESQWIKIPDHHPAIVSKKLFDEVQVIRPRFKCVKKLTHTYPLRRKVFCGCCRHAMSRTPYRNPVFYCRHSHVDENAPCHGLTIPENELEATLYEVLSKQAQIILNLNSLSNAGQSDMQLAKQSEYCNRINDCILKKGFLYEQFLAEEITMEEYKAQKAVIDNEHNRLKQLRSALSEQMAQLQMDAKAKYARTKLAHDITAAERLTDSLADSLLERIYVYPGNRVEIVWKMKDFCMEEL